MKMVARTADSFAVRNYAKRVACAAVDRLTSMAKPDAITGKVNEEHAGRRV